MPICIINFSGGITIINNSDKVNNVIFCIFQIPICIHVFSRVAISSLP